MPNEKENKSNLLNAYSFMIFYGNATSFIAHPAERLKVAAQLNLNKYTFQAIKPLLFGNLRELFTGFLSCAYKQNLKYTYRTPLLSEMPKQVDQYFTQPFFASLIKTLIACTTDTLVATPFENIKTIQMSGIKLQPNDTFTPIKPSDVQRPTIRQAAKHIYKERGALGFFVGTNVSITKSFPAWLYLFLGYEATENKRQKKDFLSTIMWATVVATPITLLTTPFDVIKSRLQAGLLLKEGENPQGEPLSKLKGSKRQQLGILQSTKTIVNQYGVLSLFKGISFRLLHRTMTTASGYVLLDMAKGFKKNS